VFKAEDAVLASAVYLKYAELEVRQIMASMGGSFGRAQQRVMEFLGLSLSKGVYSPNKASKEFLQYRRGTLKDDLEQFSARHPQRAATAHAAQAVHISQRTFGINPAGTGDSLLLIR
jgi:hypothetical protein